MSLSHSLKVLNGWTGSTSQHAVLMLTQQEALFEFYNEADAQQALSDARQVIDFARQVFHDAQMAAGA
jgi:HEPN domain-containing protein